MQSSPKQEELMRLGRRLEEAICAVDQACKIIAKNQPLIERLEATIAELEEG